MSNFYFKYYIIDASPFDLHAYFIAVNEKKDGNKLVANVKELV